jgi:hypothetical protein
MQRFDYLNPRPDRSPVMDSNVGLATALSSSPAQDSLDDIGGEPLAESGFESEQPKSDFALDGEEN